MAASALAAVAVLAGCGGDDADVGGDVPVSEAPGRNTAFGEALGELGSGTIPIGTGYGWIHMERLRTEREIDRAAPALGPGGDDVVLERHELARETGIDITRAERLLSSAASYTLGVRIDGVAGVPRALVEGARSEDVEDGWTLLDYGPVSRIPLGTPAEAFGPFGPRLATRGGTLVAARREQSRTDLIGADSDPLDDPVAALAVACLGDVVAARIVPNNFTHWPNSGPEIFAFGIRAPGEDPPDEVLCAADPVESRASEAAAAMRSAFAPSAEDLVTRRPIADEVASAELELVESEGAAAARAGIELAPGEEPGFLFGAFVRGSVVTYVGLRPPEPAGGGG